MLLPVVGVLVFLAIRSFLPYNIRFAKEFVLITLDSKTPNVTVDAWLLYKNKANAKITANIFYPFFTYLEQPAPTFVEAFEVIGKEEELTTIIPSISEVLKDYTFMQEKIFQQKEIYLMKSGEGVSLRLSLKPGEASLIHFKFIQPSSSAYHSGYGRDMRFFGYQFTISGGWGAPIGSATIMLKADPKLEIKDIALYPSPNERYWKQKSLLRDKLFNLHETPNHIYYVLNESNYIDKGFRIFYNARKEGMK